MLAFQQGYPDLTLFMSFGYSLPGAQTGNNPANLPSASYGLLAPFLDGMYDAATGNTTIIDGYELGYPISVRRNGVGAIDAAMNTMNTGVLPIVQADHEKYAEHMSTSFATWMDVRPAPWDPNNPSGNWHTPSDIEETLKASLARVDEYAWLYTERPRWWTFAGVPNNLSPAYIAAVRNATAGDMNDDGVLSNFDIGAFELALTNPAAYVATYPDMIDGKRIYRGDINTDGAFNNFDIAPFEILLTSSPAAAVPEPSTLVLAALGMLGLVTIACGGGVCVHCFSSRHVWRSARQHAGGCPSRA
jgi:hypothetical protein